MTFYVVRVAPRQEEAFLKLGSRTLGDQGVTLVYPRRSLEQRRRGKKETVEVPLFPGYVFVRTEEALDPQLYGRIKDLPGFAAFLKHEQGLSEVRGRDLELLSHFLKFGEVTPTSQVVFDENDRIRVLSGPMEGLEGQIIHVDRRKRRAKIRLDFDHGVFTVTLGFELLQTSPTGGNP